MALACNTPLLLHSGNSSRFTHPQLIIVAIADGIINFKVALGWGMKEEKRDRKKKPSPSHPGGKKSDEP